MASSRWPQILVWPLTTLRQTMEAYPVQLNDESNPTLGMVIATTAIAPVNGDRGDTHGKTFQVVTAK